MAEELKQMSDQKVGFDGVLLQQADFKAMLENIKNGLTPLNLVGACDSQKAHMVWTLMKALKRPVIYITYSEDKLFKAADDMGQFVKTDYFRAKETAEFRADAKSREITNERIATLYKLVYDETQCVITTINALMQQTLNKRRFENQKIVFGVGKAYHLEDVLAGFVAMGYKNEEQVSERGQFSVRGGIIDCFSVAADRPIRIEFFGNEIDSIREFDCETQLSVKKLKSAEVALANEGEEELENGCFLDYIKKEHIIIFDEPHRISEAAEAADWEFTERIKSLLEKKVITKDAVQNIRLHSYKAIIDGLLENTFLGISVLSGANSDYRPKQIINVAAKPVGSWNGNQEMFIGELLEYKNRNYRIVILAGDRQRAKNLDRILKENELNSVIDEKLEDMQKGIIYISGKSLSKGFEYPLINTVIISGNDALTIAKKKRKRFAKTDNTKRIRSFNDIEIGDYVVHEVHGIGIYQGINTLTVDGVTKDYVKVAYQGTDCLYVPTSQMDTLHKYIGQTEGKKKLSKFGGSDWTNAKARVRAGTEELAKKLIELYATREQQQGYSFGADTPWQSQFEDAFEYQETDDQLKSADEIKRDMEKVRPMDRLLCGDVGYGKTEVAMRAAFKAVMEGKQVAYLVPTTILAFQQFNSFVQRMKDFPITIEMLSRFRTQGEQKIILERLKSGNVDIIIGTHRIIQKDIEFKDLGLLVVDEEQRFGVSHKERLKEIKSNVDVLTLTATPIPRTLHMAMVNIRDVSVLTEPPDNRYPIETYVFEYNEAIVVDAITKEVARGGQVYYLFNRIQGLQRVAARLKEQLPDLSIAIAHGRMNEGELENIMLGLVNGEIDVLVCTTIIETGLDIPNVNTIIIEDADRLGLAQLYQIRGRVGRTNRRAFAYLTYRRDKTLSEIAEKRLTTIREFTEFGSGFKIAMRDLEIRGAGNLLGPEQHGHMDTVGYEMYCRILADTVAEMSGDAKRKPKQPTMIDIKISAYLSTDYIESNTGRIEAYKRIAEAQNDEDKFVIIEELTDRYGDIPPEASNLIDIAVMKNMAQEAGIKEISQKGDSVLLYTQNNINLPGLSRAIARFPKKITFNAGTRPYIAYNVFADTDFVKLCANIKIILQDLKEIAV